MRRLRHVAFLLARPMTMGVRVAAFDAAGRVFLVRHTYLTGWYLPGGGVDPGETVAQSVARELREEGNVELAGEPTLVSIHLNRAGLKRDHVLFFTCRNVRQSEAKRPDREIAESGFFTLDALPAGLTRGSRHRLDELGQRRPVDPYW